MPTKLNTNFPRLKDPDEFESLIQDICALEWGDPDTQKFGRKGQKQFGVDVYGHPEQTQSVYRGAQCKLRTTGKQLSEGEVDKEVAEAYQFPHKLEKLIIVTDTPRDSTTQVMIDNICEREISKGSFRVVIWFWDDIIERIAAYPKLIAKYYKDYFENITTLSPIENLVATPLRIVIDGGENSTQLTNIEEAISFRGIRILETNDFEKHLVDGLFYFIQVDDIETSDNRLLKIASTLKSHIQQLDEHCPIFVALESQTPLFVKIANKLDLNLGRIIIFDPSQNSNEIADRILNEVFSYGYSRRGGISTIEVAARTTPSRINSTFLDIDWQSRLSIDIFPSKEEWGAVFVPAIESIRHEILNQGDNIRIQFNSQLPIPAAIALGFYFNVRTARVGVWTRKSGVSDFKHQFWFSDSSPAEAKYQPEWIQQITNTGQSTIIELSTYVSIHDSVREFVERSGLEFNSWVKMQLEIEGIPPENIEVAQAIAFANQVGQLARYLNSKGITDIHLFGRIPSALAILIGQRLQACGRINLYWFENPTYRFAFILS